MHEYGHIKNKDAYQREGLIFLSILFCIEGRLRFLPFQLIVTGALIIAHRKISEYRADQEVIKRCSSDVLYSWERMFKNYCVNSAYSNGTKPHVYSRGGELYEKNRFIREIIELIQYRNWTHLSDYTRWEIFKIAAEKKFLQETENRRPVSLLKT